MSAQDLTIRRWEEAAAIARPLTPPERQALGADITARGVIYPVMVLPDGRIVDGHHRWELSGGQAPITILPPMSDPEALFLAGQLNHARRHLDQAEWKALLTRQEQRRLGVSMLSVMTLAEVAKAFGVGTSTVFHWKKAAGMDTFAKTANVSDPPPLDDEDEDDLAEASSRPYNRVKDHRKALTDLERKQMTKLYWKGVPPQDLATRFNVDVRTIRRIANAATRTPQVKAPTAPSTEPKKKTTEEPPPTRVTRSRRIYSFTDPLTAPSGASLSAWSATILSIIEFTKALRDQGVRPLVRQWPPARLAQTLTDLDTMIGQIQQLRAEVAAGALPAEPEPKDG